MARLTAKRRAKLPTSKFALSGRRYPIDSKARAANAKARALQQKKRGKLSAKNYTTVVRRANAALRRFRVKNPSGAKKRSTRRKSA